MLIFTRHKLATFLLQLLGARQITVPDSPILFVAFIGSFTCSDDQASTTKTS